MKRAVILFVASGAIYAQTAKPSLYFYSDKSGFSSNGRWAPSNPREKSAFPSETQIDCDRQSATCIEATAEYFAGHPHVSISYFKILSWDANVIVATSSDPICTTKTLLISLAEKTISNTYSAKQLDKDKAAACKLVGATGAETDTFVVKNSPGWISNP